MSKILLLGMIVLALCVSVVMAEEIVVQGTVAVTKDADNNITAITLNAGEVVYSVVLNEKGKELATSDGKKVEVRGVVTEKDKVKFIEVNSFKVIE